MTLKIKVSICIFLALASCKNQKEKELSTTVVSKQKSYLSYQHLIEAEDLMTSRSQSNTKVIDFRKLEDYEKGHIPNALQVFRPDIEDSNYPYSGMMASKITIEKLFCRLGIQNGDTLVIYDDRGGADAARLWWVLQNYDYTSVKLLNGGLFAWVAADGELTEIKNTTIPSHFRLPTESSMRFMLKREDLEKSLSKDIGPLILDVRTHQEYSGKRQKSGAMKAGRIPNAQLVDWSRAIDFHGTHKFRTYEELEALYGKLGANKEDPIITYCHSGVRSAHTTFVLSELLGYTDVKNYDGSWSEWSYFDHLPVEKDSITVILK